MRKLHRQILLTLSILIFIVVAPLLVFYAMGFRFDFRKLEVTKVGMLVVESQPESVNVFLNNKFVDNGTPFKSSSLTPGNYKIKVEKQGFFAWKKTLPVKSGKVNWASHVRLFYENPSLKQLVKDQTFDDFKYIASEKKIFLLSNYQDKEGIYEYNIDSARLTKIFPEKDDAVIYENAEFSDLKLSLNGRYAFFSWKDKSMTKNYMIANSEKVINLNTVFGYEITNPNWSMKNDSLIYWIYKDNLYSYNADSSSIPSVALTSVSNFAISDDYVFLEKFENEKYVLKRAKENSLGSNIFLIENPENIKIVEIKVGLKNAVAFKLENNVLYLVKQKKNSNDFLATKIFENPLGFVWSEKENKLLYYNDVEMWFYELINRASDIPIIHNEYKINNANLIARSQTKIEKAIWYPDFEHVLYNIDKRLNVIELDERSTKNMYTFNNFMISDFAPDLKGENLIFLNQDKYLFETRISEDDALF
ncbi:MAG: PEGA domain-containing protein [Patescibacteria group bacterium]|nr:PEGA domain-containing protein [Patescibacteria group bacterium]